MQPIPRVIAPVEVCPFIRFQNHTSTIFTFHHYISCCWSFFERYTFWSSPYTFNFNWQQSCSPPHWYGLQTSWVPKKPYLWSRPFLINTFGKAFKVEWYQAPQSTTYHLQTDGKIGVLNRVLELYLWAYVHGQPSQWLKFLSLAKWSYNNTPHFATRITPFKATFWEISSHHFHLFSWLLPHWSCWLPSFFTGRFACLSYLQIA